MKISTEDSGTIIVTNEVQKFTFNDKNSSISYRYFSNSDFLMFVTADMGTVKVTVTDYKRNDDTNVVEIFID